MTIDPKIWEFPSFPISDQLFHVPGQALAGGITSGGAQIISPEPGGFAMLEITPALQVNEWNYPAASWLMSKGNGAIMRVRLAPTPQISWSARRNGSSVPWDTGLLWSNDREWEGDFSGVFTAVALEGSTQLVIDLTGVGQALQFGHVIGHGNYTYLIDEIEYDGDVATVIVTPPLRNDVAIGDAANLRPWFLGRIANIGEIRSSYKAADNGHIQLGKIILNEAII